jgi:hypothetical protein
MAIIRRSRWAAVVFSGALVLAACGGSDGDESSSVADSAKTSEGGWLDGDAPPSSRAPTGEELYAADDSTALATEGAPPLPATGSGEVDPHLSAGSIDDNELWDQYLLYRQAFESLGLPISPVEVEGRQIIEVTDGEGQPVVAADLEVRDSSGSVVETLRTYSDGRALFHAPTTADPNTQQRTTFEVTASKGGTSTTIELDPEIATHPLVLDGAENGALALDVLFLIDATGSMSDEIERLKANISSVSEQIGTLSGEPDVRFAMTVYRDRGDAYVTRTFDFTSDLGQFSGALDEVVADGGGDTPESLGAALDEAVNAPSWRDDDAVKLVFLVADAPPHLSGDAGFEDEPDYARSVLDAARRGIKIMPVASSGIDAQGEYVFRQLAQITMGRLVFLTYGADGSSPGSSTPLNVAPDDYDVLSLDALIVQLVGDELEPLTR